MNLIEALAHVQEHGFGDDVDADAVIRRAAEDLVAVHYRHNLGEVSGDSGADQLSSFYDVLNRAGLPVE